ncbi:hypothetical protein PQR02_22415 [Paraburkholderia sediminicola]|uniref:Uncharacterized protein n=1 Tax=Paraburkholderia rhynchosiae TaxID=487049 RepID=A0ACC7NBW0_9BURK
MAFSNPLASEAIMQCGYHGWIIDATPDFGFGKFFAHARLVRATTDDDVDGEMHIERNLSWFDTEEEAIEVAQQWAFAWIGKRDGDLAARQFVTPTIQSDISAGVSAG